MRRERGLGTTGKASARRGFVRRGRLGLGLLAWAALSGAAWAQEPPPAASPAAPAALTETAPPLDAPEIQVPGTPPAAAAQGATAPDGAAPEIVLQLNNLQPIQPSGCRFTFLATNNREAPIERLGVELVVFDAQRRVDQFLVLEFTRLAAKKTKVSQFDLAERSCNDVSQLLVNDVVNCGIEEGATPTCAERVKLENLTDIDLAY